MQASRIAGQRITLAQPMFAGEPGVRGSRSQGYKFWRKLGFFSTHILQESLNPRAARILSKEPPINCVEGFGEVKLEDKGWSFPFVKALDQFKGIDEVFLRWISH